MIKVQPAQDHEIDRVAEIHRAARSAYYRAAGNDPDPAKEQQAEDWAGYLELPRMQLACAYAVPGTDAIGFACAYDGQEASRDGLWSVELVALYVDPSHWSHGAGSALHRWYQTVLRDSATAEAGTLYVWSSKCPRPQLLYPTRLAGGGPGLPGTTQRAIHLAATRTPGTTSTLTTDDEPDVGTRGYAA
jgi:GNAT superfamily N-acetyltransferase